MVQEPEHEGPRDPAMLIQAKVADVKVVSERHAQIIPVALRLFIEKGFHKTTTRDIASALGWNMGTLYLYIESKEDILYLVCDAIMRADRKALIISSAPASATDTLRAAMERYFNTIAERRGELNFMYRESASLRREHRHELTKGEVLEIDFFAAIIREGIVAGEFCDVNARLIAQDIIMLAHMWALKNWLLHPYLTFEEFLEHQTEVIFSRLQPRRRSSASAK